MSFVNRCNISSSSVSGGDLLGHRTDIYLASVDIATQSDKVVEPIDTPINMYESSHCLTCLPTRDMVSLFNLSHSGAYVALAHCGLTFQFPDE